MNDPLNVPKKFWFYKKVVDSKKRPNITSCKRIEWQNIDFRNLKGQCFLVNSSSSEFSDGLKPSTYKHTFLCRCSKHQSETRWEYPGGLLSDFFEIDSTGNQIYLQELFNYFLPVHIFTNTCKKGAPSSYKWYITIPFRGGCW